MAIVAVHNHSPEQIEEAVIKLGFKFEMWDAKLDRKEIKNDVIYGFTSVTQILSTKLKTTPIVFDIPSATNHVGLNTRVVYVDADIKIDGLIYFTDLKLKRLKKALSTKFKDKYRDAIIFRKNNLYLHGINSQLTRLVNRFLVSIPSFTHEAFMVAFANTLKTNKWSKFESFLKENRLITNQNKKALLELGERINKMYPCIKHLVADDKNNFTKQQNILCKKDESYKLCIKRIRFYLRYWGDKKLKTYLDSEGNINHIV